MGTAALSKIKTARKPAVGNSYPCAECRGSIRPGDQYFSYQTGLHCSVAYCLECARTDRPAFDEHGREVDRQHHKLYAAKYSVITRGNAATLESVGIVRAGKLIRETKKQPAQPGDPLNP